MGTQVPGEVRFWTANQWRIRGQGRGLPARVPVTS